MTAATAIDRRARPVTITRLAAGAYVGGIWVPGAPSNIAIRAVIQPLTGKERQNMPEGIRDSGQWSVWSRSELKTSDTLTINGTASIIVAAENWGEHYKAIAGDANAST